MFKKYSLEEISDIRKYEQCEQKSVNDPWFLGYDLGFTVCQRDLVKHGSAYAHAYVKEMTEQTHDKRDHENGFLDGYSDNLFMTEDPDWWKCD